MAGLIYTSGAGLVLDTGEIALVSQATGADVPTIATRQGRNPEGGLDKRLANMVPPAAFAVQVASTASVYLNDAIDNDRFLIWFVPLTPSISAIAEGVARPMGGDGRRSLMTICSHVRTPCLVSHTGWRCSPTFGAESFRRAPWAMVIGAGISSAVDDRKGSRFLGPSPFRPLSLSNIHPAAANCRTHNCGKASTMPDGTLTSISVARQAASSDVATDFGNDNRENTRSVVLDLPQARPEVFDPAAWLALADAAGVQVNVVVQEGRGNVIWFGMPDDPIADGSGSDPVQLLRRDGRGKERTALVAAHILSNEPDRVCRAGVAA